MIKRHFMAGLALLLPVALTLFITTFIVNLLTKPFQGMLQYFIQEYHLHILGSPEAVLVISKIAILIFLFIFTIILGFIAQAYFIHYFFKFSDMIMTRIPLVNKIYKAIKDVMSTVFTTGSNSYSQVVLVPYPKASTWAIGLITQADTPVGSDAEHLGMISVFVPGTPNPTVGFMLLFRREQIVFIDMTVDEAMRFIVSCGVMTTPFMKTPISSSSSV